MRGTVRGFVFFEEKGLLIELFLEDGLHACKGARLDQQYFGPSRFEANWRIPFG
jgi:hypothetical protein